MADWTIEDNTGKGRGYLRLLRNGRRIADFFPFAADEDADFIQRQAARIADVLNDADRTDG